MRNRGKRVGVLATVDFKRTCEKGVRKNTEPRMDLKC